LRSNGNHGVCGGSGGSKSSGFAAAARQIVGKVERHPGTPTALGQNQKRMPTPTRSYIAIRFCRRRGSVACSRSIAQQWQIRWMRSVRSDRMPRTISLLNRLHAMKRA
jgi:hypothetical protein